MFLEGNINCLANSIFILHYSSFMTNFILNDAVVAALANTSQTIEQSARRHLAELATLCADDKRAFEAHFRRTSIEVRERFAEIFRMFPD